MRLLRLFVHFVRPILRPIFWKIQYKPGKTSKNQEILEKKEQIKNNHIFCNRSALWLFFWQGQKDLNPRPTVLETAALPTELYPYNNVFYISSV